MGGTWFDWIFLIVTGAVAFYGFTYRDARGERPWIHLLFGAIAILYFGRTLFSDILSIL